MHGLGEGASGQSAVKGDCSFPGQTAPFTGQAVGSQSCRVKNHSSWRCGMLPLVLSLKLSSLLSIIFPDADGAAVVMLQEHPG